MDLKGHQLGSPPHIINPQSGGQNSMTLRKLRGGGKNSGGQTE